MISPTLKKNRYITSARLDSIVTPNLLIFIFFLLFNLIKQNMGKRDFDSIYRHIKSTQGSISCKISYYSDQFNSSKNYAGIIIYGMNGKTSWKNLSGQAAGFNGRSIYIIIKDTSAFPDQRAVGSGRVHFYPLEQVLGSHIDKNEVLCGGFAYHQGTLKFSSIWLNQNENQTDFTGGAARCDGSKYLSEKEKILVQYCWDEYRKFGPHAVFEIPSEIENRILRR